MPINFCIENFVLNSIEKVVVMVLLIKGYKKVSTFMVDCTIRMYGMPTEWKFPQSVAAVL